MYAIMLLLGTITACIMLSPGLQSTLQNVPFCETPNATNNLNLHHSDILNNLNPIPNKLKIDCNAATGYLAVYRLCFGMTMFFFVMSLLMIGVKSSKDPRAGIQNG